MAQFATAAELGERLGITLTPDETTRADALLTRASGLVQDEARQVIEKVTDDVLTIVGTNDERIHLPERPVLSVSSITLNGQDVGGWYLDGNSIVRNGLDIDVRLSVLDAGFGWPFQELEITYSHGFETPPPTVAAIVLEAVVRVWVNPGAVVNERHGSESVQFSQSNPTGLLLTDAERRSIRRLFGAGRSGSVNQS